MAEIQKVSIKHEAILHHLMVHPQVRLSEVAAHFGITQGWLSQVIHSDAFQERLRECQGIAFHSTVLPIREKMLAVAHQALDTLAERMPLEMEPKNLSAIAGDVLDRLGFSSKGPSVQVNQQNNHFTVLRSEIEDARRLFGGQATPPPLEVATDGTRTLIALPGESGPSLGSAFEATALALVSGENGETEAGGAV